MPFGAWKEDNRFAEIYEVVARSYSVHNDLFRVSISHAQAADDIANNPKCKVPELRARGPTGLLRYHDHLAVIDSVSAFMVVRRL